jgi:diguanylate cyclase (GGDEF)-like protein
MVALQLVNLVGAFAALFLIVRVFALDRRALRARQRSWIALMGAVSMLCVVLAVELYAGVNEGQTGLRLTRALAESGLVALLVAACYFLYVREHTLVRDLIEREGLQRVRSRRLEAILGLSSRLRAAHTMREVAEIAVASVHTAFGFNQSALYLYGAEDDVFVSGAVVGGDEDYNAVVRDRRIPGDLVRGLLREEFRSGDCYFIDHREYEWTEDELFYFPPAELPDLGPGRFHADDALFVPLRDHEGRLVALFDVYDPEDGLLPGADVCQVLEIFANVTASALENARYGEELAAKAVSDGLTGLYNHRHFQETLAHEVERAGRYDLVFTLLMMDLDRFKAVNDRLGHPRGDRALQMVADVLRECARTTDFVGRYGGEEFVMILPGTTVQQALSLATRITEGVRAIVLAVDDPPRLSISIGMAEYPDCGRDRESLIAAADAALLFAKRSGRDMIADFSQVSTVELDAEGLEGLASRLEKADIETFEALAAAVDLRDSSGPGRSGGVAAMAEDLATALQLDAEQRDLLHVAALVYDIGKLGVPVEVLNRQGRLSEDELVKVRQHPELGIRLLRSAAWIDALMPVVLYHHERWDGSGYPAGLEGEQIPFAARVIALCDAYLAMVTDRPYRRAMRRDEALEELRRGAGTQFDPRLVATFMATVTGARLRERQPSGQVEACTSITLCSSSTASSWGRWNELRPMIVPKPPPSAV